MGIFSRFKDIINSNINAMLDSAEDPEKLIKLMISEMEDTLVEIKASCAGTMAGKKKVVHHLDEVKERENYWEGRAKLAVEKGRDDLAREALTQKKNFTRRVEAMEKEIVEHDVIIEQYKDDMRQLEEKLASARDRQRMLLQRHIRATRKKRAQEEIRRADSSYSLAKFDELENRIERMESEADLVNFGKKHTLEDEFDKLEVDDEIEQELKRLKAGKEKG